MTTGGKMLTMAPSEVNMMKVLIELAMDEANTAGLCLKGERKPWTFTRTRELVLENNGFMCLPVWRACVEMGLSEGPQWTHHLPHCCTFIGRDRLNEADLYHCPNHHKDMPPLFARLNVGHFIAPAGEAEERAKHLGLNPQHDEPEKPKAYRNAGENADHYAACLE